MAIIQKKSVKDIDVKGKRVIVRVDFNVPQDKEGKITDDKGSSLLYLFAGSLQVTINGTVLTVKGDLNAAPVW